MLNVGDWTVVANFVKAVADAVYSKQTRVGPLLFCLLIMGS
jgi:hypothetical protein